MYDQCRVNIWSMYDQCMISAWSMYDMFIDVFQSLLAFCKDLIRHATERCFNGILKCIFRCVVGQEAASPTLGHSRFFWFSLTPLALRKPSNQVPPNSDFLGACTFRPKPNLFEGKRNHQHSYCSTIAVAAKVWFQIWRLGPVGCVSFLTCTFDALCICVLEFCLIVCFQQVTSQSNCRPNLCVSCVSEFPLSVFL